MKSESKPGKKNRYCVQESSIFNLIFHLTLEAIGMCEMNTTNYVSGVCCCFFLFGSFFIIIFLSSFVFLLLFSIAANESTKHVYCIHSYIQRERSHNI